MKRIVHIISIVMILCLAATDVMLYKSQAGDIVTEYYGIDTAMADGNFNDENSDKENGLYKTVTLGEGKHLFSILEIYPSEKKGVAGYMVGGCEPFDFIDEVREGNRLIASEQEMKMACMDAMINDVTGTNSSGYNIPGDYSNLSTLNQKLQEMGSGEMEPFDFRKGYTEGVVSKGYYKYVGKNKGFFSCDDPDKKKNSVMRSKFHSNSGSFDYIFVNNATSTNGNDINVENYRRITYKNNDKFIRDFLGIPDSKLEKWKEEHEVRVTTKTPVSVTLKDIDQADIIFINNADNMGFPIAKDIYNKLHNTSGSSDDNAVFSKAMDFVDFTEPDTGIQYKGFEKVIKIYERIVVREDAAIVAERNCLNLGNLTRFETNVQKLMCMLFFVGKKGSGNGPDISKPGKGRDVFMNYIKRYVDEPGNWYMARREEHETHFIQDTDSKGNPLYDSSGNPIMVHDPLYPDYRAPSLRHNDYDKGIPYMHYRPLRDPGHPLVLDPSEAIIGGKYVDGELVALHDSAKAIYNQMYRKSPDMYIADKIDEKAKDDDGNYIDDSFGYYKGTNSIAGHSEYIWFMDAYESMSNTTDYIYIDDEGNLQVSAKYSSDNYSSKGTPRYWYNIDDDYDGGHEYKMIAWDAKTYKVWPWVPGSEPQQSNGELPEWFFHTSVTGKNGYSGDLHLWFDYYVYGNYRGIAQNYLGNMNANHYYSYENQSLVLESNGFFKSDYVKNAVTHRKVRREDTDPKHMANQTEKDYYISMNILNGDGVNVVENKPTNKTIYYNEYENFDNRITNYESVKGKAYIPLKIRLESSCKLIGITIQGNGHEIYYPIDLTVTNEMRLPTDASSELSSSPSGGKGLVLKRPPDTLKADNTPKKTTSVDGTPIHTFEGEINDVMYDWYSGRRNTEVTVTLTVLLPNDTQKDISDTVTIVRRDFFMLN